MLKEETGFRDVQYKTIFNGRHFYITLKKYIYQIWTQSISISKVKLIKKKERKERKGKKIDLPKVWDHNQATLIYIYL